PRECHVFPNRAIEEKRFLQYDAKLRAIGIQFHRRKVHAVNEHSPARRHIKRSDQPDDGGFSRSRRTHQRRNRSWVRAETHIVQDFLSRVISKAYAFHLNKPVYAIE